MQWNDNGSNFISKPSFLTFLLQQHDKTSSVGSKNVLAAYFVLHPNIFIVSNFHWSLMYQLYWLMAGDLWLWWCFQVVISQVIKISDHYLCTTFTKYRVLRQVINQNLTQGHNYWCQFAKLDNNKTNWMLVRNEFQTDWTNEIWRESEIQTSFTFFVYYL